MVDNDQNAKNKTFFWIISGWQLLLELLDIYNGRFVSAYPFNMFFGVYIALYSQKWNDLKSRIIFNVFIDILIAYQNYLWMTFGQEDFGNYLLHGKYGVGFRRWKAKNGNDCLIFYPCNK